MGLAEENARIQSGLGLGSGSQLTPQTDVFDSTVRRLQAFGLVAAWPPVLEAAVGNGPPSSGGLEAVGVFLYAGQTISSIGFCITSAALTPTHFWCAVYDSNYNLVAQSADNTTPLASTGWLSLPLTAPYRAPVDGIYYLCHLQIAGTPASMPRCAAQGAMSGTGLPSGKYPWWFQGGQTGLPATATPASSGNGYVTVAF